MNRTEFLKRLALLGMSGSLAPRLFASSPLQTNLLSEELDETGPFQFLTQPYLQISSQGVMTISWITNRNSFSWVEFGDSGDLSQKAVSDVDGLHQANNHIHKIRLENIKPGVKCAYKVCSTEIIKYSPYIAQFGETIESRIYHFVMPSIGADEISMLIINDIHDRPESIAQLISLNGNDPYDFVCLNGDSITILDSETQLIRDVVSPCAEAFATEKPLLFVRGNHEPRGGYARHLYDYIDTGAKPYYSFTAGPAFFIVLDTGEDKNDDHKEYVGLVSFDSYREKEAKWLEQELKSPAAKKAKFRVVIMHIPHYYSGESHGTMHCRELFGPLFNKGKVDIAICGHTHRYGVFAPVEKQHNFPIMIGGGPRDGSRTLIKLRIDRKKLDVVMLDDSGKVVGSYG
jgi:predicted phosphodiesterase